MREVCRSLRTVFCLEGGSRTCCGVHSIGMRVQQSSEMPCLVGQIFCLMLPHLTRPSDMLGKSVLNGNEKWRTGMSGWTLLRFLLAMLVTFGLMLIAVPKVAGAAEEEAPPAPEKGLELAERLCKNCHLIGNDVGTSVPAGPPTFRGIANRAGVTGQQIMDVLIKPHAPMPDMHLSGPEINDLNAYLETLRAYKTAPPLVSTWSPKPKMPSKS